MKRPIFRRQSVALLVGLAGLGIAWLGLWDAYQGRGQDTPRVLRPITWW